MKRVVGLGGIFFKSKDPKALYEWYRRHLGIASSTDGSGAMWATPTILKFLSSMCGPSFLTIRIISRLASRPS